MLEQRKYERFTIASEIRALACDKVARVIDISKGGLALVFLDEAISNLRGEFSLDLLCQAKNLDARQIPGKVVWNREVSFSKIPGMVYKKAGVQFGKLSVTQQKVLRTLLFADDKSSS